MILQFRTSGGADEPRLCRRAKTNKGYEEENVGEPKPGVNIEHTMDISATHKKCNKGLGIVGRWVSRIQRNTKAGLKLKEMAMKVKRQK